MSLTKFNYTTGPSALVDVGQLTYNGCTFSPLFASNIQGNLVKDQSNRTVKMVEYQISVDGYVTSAGNAIIDSTSDTLRHLLTAQGGELIYRGRGFDLRVNSPGVKKFDEAARDVAWGPVPELLEYQPLGGGRGAKITWRVTVRIVHYTNRRRGGVRAEASEPLLQFNCDTTVTYNDDYYSTLSVSGTIEIPKTREIQSNRTLTSTVDDVRGYINEKVFDGIDLTRFRPTRREFNVSRDKRTLEFDISAEELPYMDLPPYCAQARGSFQVRPKKSGLNIISWLCTLRVTYTVRKDRARRFAWVNFLALMRYRMRLSIHSGIGAGGAEATPSSSVSSYLLPIIPGFNALYLAQSYASAVATSTGTGAPPRQAQLLDFQIDEGLFQDSKTTTFSATWWLISRFENVLAASGLWRKLAEEDSSGNNLWAISMRDVSGSQSWLPNTLDPNADFVVDFGEG